MENPMKLCCSLLVLVVLGAGAAHAQAPAARQGDPTSHGGVVLTGTPTVVIGGRPAARVEDTASCPVVPPEPGALPHVGGPITTGSSTVLIGGKPAARAGDTVTETGATSIVVVGAPTVLIGN
jgi:uncharacterized Zn-binding protein involved in type VI secretion